MNAHHHQDQDSMNFLDSSPGHGVDHNDLHNAGPWPHHPPANPWGPDLGWGAGRRPTHRTGAGYPHWGAGHPRWGPGPPPRQDGPVPDRTTDSAPANDGKPEGSDRTVDHSEPIPDPAEVTPGEDDPDSSSGGPCRRGGHRAGYFHGQQQRQQHPFAFGPSPNWATLPGMVHGLVSPLIRDFRDQARCYAADAFASSGNDGSNATSFTPPVDVFDTQTSYVVHVALPGARKEDLGVAWDPDTARLRVAGVVHRPGDEPFLAALASGERRVGLFERHVVLPPAGAAARDGGDGDLVDADNISAKMENGILVVVVPKLEKDWTQIRRVDIE